LATLAFTFIPAAAGASIPPKDSALKANDAVIRVFDTVGNVIEVLTFIES